MNNENILDFIFEARSESLAKINEEDLNFLHSKKGNITRKYEDFQALIFRLPDKTKNEILEKFNNYSDTSDYVHGYFCKKY